jgi:hypothetical protein
MLQHTGGGQGRFSARAESGHRGDDVVADHNSLETPTRHARAAEAYGLIASVLGEVGTTSENCIGIRQVTDVSALSPTRI